MSIKASLMASGACMALVMMAAPAFAQDAAKAAAPAEETVVVVTGLRKSFQNATNLKKNASQIVDLIVAEDIGKMPDTNIAETLQRIPGVQISRNTRGEGNAYVVHGLKQVMTTVNGRTFFTTTNRSANLLDFSADILSGVDVYKTATADQIEGGLGGLINIQRGAALRLQGFPPVGHGSGELQFDPRRCHAASVRRRQQSLEHVSWRIGSAGRLPV